MGFVCCLFFSSLRVCVRARVCVAAHIHEATENSDRSSVFAFEMMCAQERSRRVREREKYCFLFHEGRGWACESWGWKSG